MSEQLDDLDQLRLDLHLALQVEHATVPPYLAAWASTDNASASNPEPRQILRSVFTEEMLHMTQVANLLLAVGGTPTLAHDGFVPTYPHALPGAAPGWVVDIGPLAPAAVEDFLRIEYPAGPDAPPEESQWHTIGQFYAAVRLRFQKVLAEHPGLLAENAHRQIPPGMFYGSAVLRAVETAADVEAAFDLIIAEGEGFDGSVFDEDPSIDGGPGFEPAHYYRFVEIAAGRRFQPGDTRETGPTGSTFAVDYDSVSPMRVNATLADYADAPDVLAKLRQFNEVYGRLLWSLEQAFQGTSEAFVAATAEMFAVGRAAAAIARMPDPTLPGSTVGLVFEPVFPSPPGPT